jgi:phosphotransferase system HPr-like phosphotransfer protein
MTLGVGNGEEVEIVTDDEALLEKIVELVETDLDAEDA